MTQRFGPLVLDANCLLNLYATDHLRDIVIKLPFQFWVTDYVAEREALFIWRPSPTAGKEVREPVDLTSLLEEGLIHLMCLNHRDEEATYIALAAELDEGEAITGALALHRGYSVATDDRKARRVLGQLHSPIRMFSTLELMNMWAKEVKLSTGVLGEAMAKMKSSASYVPGANDPHYEWWRSIICQSSK